MKALVKFTLAVVGISVCALSCKDPDAGIKEVPGSIASTKPCSDLYPNIMEQFPEFSNNKTKQQILFSASTKKEVLLLKESEVYVTFISEGAGLNNTFGYYLYDTSAKPLSPSEVELKVLFPHVSNKVLKAGDRVQVGEGKIKGGTVIGFFVILQGYENETVHFDRTTVFTDLHFNPGKGQQHVLYKENECGDLVLAFEDKIVTQSADRDYNDLIFTVTDNTANKDISTFDLRAVIRM